MDVIKSIILYIKSSYLIMYNTYKTGGFLIYIYGNTE